MSPPGSRAGAEQLGKGRSRSSCGSALLATITHSSHSVSEPASDLFMESSPFGGFPKSPEITQTASENLLLKRSQVCVKEGGGSNALSETLLNVPSFRFVFSEASC